MILKVMLFALDHAAWKPANSIIRALVITHTETADCEADGLIAGYALTIACHAVTRFASGIRNVCWGSNRSMSRLRNRCGRA